MQPANNSEYIKALGTAFSHALTKGLTESCRLDWKTAAVGTPAGKLPQQDAALFYRFSFAGALDGHCFLAVRQDQVAAFGFRKVESKSNSFTEEHADALLSALESITDGLCASIQEYGAIRLAVERVVAPELPEEGVLELAARSGPAEPSISIFLSFDLELLESVAASPAAHATPSNLDLVLDVELNVTLRFGQRQLSLREVLDLSSGSVVELDRQVDEPVELVLDGRVVARGEAVIIDGNYGLRITQVVQQVFA